MVCRKSFPGPKGLIATARSKCVRESVESCGLECSFDVGSDHVALGIDPAMLAGLGRHLRLVLIPTGIIGTALRSSQPPRT